MSRPRANTREIPRRVRFSGDISRRAGREIDPDRIFDLDATRAMCCCGSLGGIPFTSPTTTLRRRLTIRGRSTRVKTAAVTTFPSARGNRRLDFLNIVFQKFTGDYRRDCRNFLTLGDLKDVSDVRSLRSK